MFWKKYATFNKRTLQSRYNHNWVKPTGHRTGIKLYNCVTRQHEPFIVRNKDLVTWYTCGPTVYDSSHIGHGCCYVKLDIIQRILKEHFDLNIVTCMNITDIDDKIITKAHESNQTFKEVAQTNEKEFWTDLNNLKVNRPDVILKVSEHIPLMIEFIEKLHSEDKAYKGKDNSVYFDNSKSPFPPGKLQNISTDLSPTTDPFKKSSSDFALWKSSKEGEPFFESPWGKGRPGWHIECSALASHVFGSNIDVHAGGIDLRFPHHENEEIQSCSFHDNCQWVNYWIHTGHLHLKDSEKMSKSLKNTISIQDMLETTHVDVFRLACAMTNYHSPMEFSSELIGTSSNMLKLYKNFFVTCLEIISGISKPTLNNDILVELLVTSVSNIHEAYCDNFDTPKVVSIISNIVSNVNSMLHNSTYSAATNNGVTTLIALNKLIVQTLSTFGVDLDKMAVVSNTSDDVELINLIVNFRQDVRKVGLVSKNADILKLSDSLRDDLKKLGLNVKDHKENVSSWSK